MTVLAWIDEQRVRLRPSVRPIPWSRNREWQFQDGVLRHHAGGYFSIVGACIEAPGTRLHDLETVMIDQPEVGLLGFIASVRENGIQWLLQAKLEPGNVHHVQAAPTVQATRSNYQRVHGGSPTQFLEFFHGDDVRLAADTLQSEQGFSFLGKFNRNALRLVPEAFECRNASFRWFPADELRAALAHDFLVNTDARSAIVCAPWRFIAAGRRLFSSPSLGHLSEFVSLQSDSYHAGTSCAGRLTARLRAAGARGGLAIRRLSLESLRNWAIGEADIHCKDGNAAFDVVSMDVVAPGREVEHWQQPLLRGLKEHRVGLLFQVRDGCLKVFLRISIEPGFGCRAEYGPSFQSDGASPRWIEELILESDRSPLLSVRQSDEGGRFMQAVTRYELHVLDEAVTLPESEEGEWVGTADLEVLCRTPGLITNEARSAVSLLLSLG